MPTHHHVECVIINVLKESAQDCGALFDDVIWIIYRYHSQLEGGRVPVYAFNFQEPENDPRNCCYLWAVQSAQDL